MVSSFFVLAFEPLAATARCVISELSYQAGLSDARRTSDKHNSPRPVQRCFQFFPQKGQIFFTADDRLSSDGRSRFTYDRFYRRLAAGRTLTCLWPMGNSDGGNEAIAPTVQCLDKRRLLLGHITESFSEFPATSTDKTASVTLTAGQSVLQQRSFVTI